MFRRTRRKMTAAVGGIDAPATPQRTTVHNNAPNYAAPLVVLVLFLLSLLPVGWLALVFLADTAGFENPSRVVANLIVYSLCILFPLSIVIVLIAKLVAAWFDHRERLANTLGEWKYKQAMATRQLVGNSRTMGDDLRFVRLVEHVMMEAYHHLETHGQYTKNDAKPWARNQAQRVVLSDEREPVGFAMGSKVRSWLQERNVLNGDTINVTRFPDIGSVQSLLRLEFEIPVDYGQPPALDDGRDWSSIELQR